MTGIVRALTVTAALTLAIAGCAEPTAEERPDHATTPDGWTTVESSAGDLRLDLPPWMVPFETHAAIFANEAPAQDGQTFLQLLAEGPRTAESQPAPGESLEQWLEARIETRGRWRGTTRRTLFATGPGVVIERVLSPGSSEEWRLAAYAIETPFGVAYLLIDGPMTAWVGHEADAELIPLLMDVGPGRTGG